MDSKEEMTLSQKIVTDAVLKMDDYKKMKWLTRRYGKGKALDKAFDKVFSSLKKTHIFEISQRIKLLQDLNASHDRISNEIEDLIENVTQDKIDFSPVCIIDIINTIKDNQLKFELIEFYSSESEGSHYDCEAWHEGFDRSVIITLEESNNLKSILSLLSLRTTDYEIIKAIGNKLSSIELTPEVIQTIANMPKIEIEEKQLRILHNELLRDNKMSKATLILFNVIKEEQKMELLSNNLFIIPNIETELEKSNAKEKETLKSLYKTLTPFLLPKNAPEKLANEYYGNRYSAGTLDFTTVIEYKDFLKDVDLRPALFWYKTLDNFKNQDEMFEYFDMLKTWPDPDSHSYYYGLGFYSSNDFNLKEAISNKCCESMKKNLNIVPRKGNYPQSFVEEHKELFLPDDIPSDLKQMIHDGIRVSYIIVNHPEWVKYFKNIDLNLVGKLFDNNNELIDSNSVLTEFNSREDALLCLSYFTEISSYATKVISQNNIKQRMFDTIYSQIINVFNPIGKYQAGYAFALPEEFKKKYPELFLPENAPDELKNKVYHYKLEPKDIVEHPEWIHYLSKINLNIIIPNYDKTETHTSEVDSFKNQEETIKYFAMLNYIRGDKARFYYYPSKNVKNEFIKSIKNTMTNYEYYPTIFTPNIFFDSSVIDAIKENNLDQSFRYLCFYCQDMSYLNPEEVAKYFESREDAIKCCMMYKYIQCIQQYNKFNSDLNTDNIKESLFSVIHKAICVGILPYNEDMPEDFKKEFPDLFLSTDAPVELKQLMYNRCLRGENLLDHPEWIAVLTKENINLNVLFNLINNNNEHIDVNILAERFDSREDAIRTFATYILIMKATGNIDVFAPKESMYKNMYESILEGAKYPEDMPEDFKKEHPELFLDKTIPEDIRTEFYQKQFTLEDFEENPNLIKTFGNTNLLFGLKDSQYCFMGTLFKGHDANNDCLKAIEIFDSSTNSEEAEFIRNSIKKSNMRVISIDKFPDLIELHKDVQYSNSIELSSFKDNYMPEILNSDNPVAAFKLLEDIFLKNSLPGYAKLFKCFKTIYPTFEKAPGGYSPGFNFTPGSRISPELLEAGDAEHRFLIVYNDLLRIAIHSQDSSLVEYLDNIDKGSELYFALCKKEKTIETISNEEVEELTTFASHLESIYEGISFPYQDELKELTPEQNNSVKKFKLLNRMSAKDYFKDRNDLVQIDKLEKYKRAMLKTKISILSKKFNASTIESADNLKDKIVSYIGHSAGYDSFNQMVEDINKIRNETDKRNRKRAEEYRNKPFMFEEGDFLRCIGGIKALTGSINKGNVSKEFMCSYTGTSGSDTTPLDVDITYMYPKSGITTSIDGGTTGWGFGNVFVVIKKDNPNLNITRDSGGNLLESEYDVNKIETFGTKTIQGGTGIHWGARTGITFTDIDFILYKETKIIERNADGLPQVDENGDIVYVKNSIQIPNYEWVPIVHDALAEIQFEIARNGYYIPVFDMLGRLSFTPEQYDELRSKMCGLPHYTSEEYHISNKLDFPGIDELIEIKKADMKKTAVREKLIREKIKEIMKTSKLKVDTIAVTDTLSTDLTEGIVQLIGTGSTSRGTNVPDDSDFDYMLKVDKKVVQAGMDELISSLKNIKHDEDNSHDNRVKLVGVTIDGLDIKIDTDISIAQKQNDITYSTEMALEERLETIRKQSQSAYEKVIANIVYAKQFLKEIGTYKHARVDKTSGGLGGVGVENWILQNGGSFRQACETFMDKAIDHETGQIVPFENFRKTYTIWDFGENHESKGQHPFDEYVSLNMNEAGYNKLVKELPKKLKEINEGLSKNRTIESTTPIIEEEIIEEEPLEASVGFGR